MVDLIAEGIEAALFSPTTTLQRFKMLSEKQKFTLNVFIFPDARVVVVVVDSEVVVTPDDCTPNGIPENGLKLGMGNVEQGIPGDGIIPECCAHGVISGNGKLGAGAAQEPVFWGCTVDTGE